MQRAAADSVLSKVQRMWQPLLPHILQKHLAAKLLMFHIDVFAAYYAYVKMATINHYPQWNLVPDPSFCCHS